MPFGMVSHYAIIDGKLCGADMLTELPPMTARFPDPDGDMLLSYEGELSEALAVLRAEVESRGLTWIDPGEPSIYPTPPVPRKIIIRIPQDMSLQEAFKLKKREDGARHVFVFGARVVATGTESGPEDQPGEEG